MRRFVAAALAAGEQVILSGSRGRRSVAFSLPLTLRGRSRSLGRADTVTVSDIPGRLWLGRWSTPDNKAARVSLREVDANGGAITRRAELPRRWSTIEAVVDNHFLGTDAHGLDQPIWLATAETAIAMIRAVRGNPATTERATARAEQLAPPLCATHLVALAQSGPILSALPQVTTPKRSGWRSACSTRGIRRTTCTSPAWASAISRRRRTPAARRRRVRGWSRSRRWWGDAPAEWVAITLRHARAVLADGEREAAAYFEEALGADLDRWPLWRGRPLLVHGRWLRGRRRATESRAPLRKARDIFDAIGASGWGEHARAELRASGERSRRRVP